MKNVFCFFILLFCLGGGKCFSQQVLSLFQSLDWEQASLVAARENKLVFVEVGEGDAGDTWDLLDNFDLVQALERQVIAIRVHVNSPQGRTFLPRLLHYPCPCYAFFMPYGDLVGVVGLEQVKERPTCLLETLEEARTLAKAKQESSRTVRFVDLTLPEVLSAAKEERRKVFVYFAEPSEYRSLWMERNVFALNRVADVYNREFLNVRVLRTETGDWEKKYGIHVADSPVLLFLNAEGKMLYRSAGCYDADGAIACANAALEKAKGIPFKELEDVAALHEASKEGKLLFVDYHADNRVHQELAEHVFTDPEVTDYFTGHFVNVSRIAEENVLLFLNCRGEELHRVCSVQDAGDLLAEARKAVEGRGVGSLQARYRQGERDARFVEDYIVALARAGKGEEASEVVMAYLDPLSPACLKEDKYWQLFYSYGKSAAPAFLDYLLAHRGELFELYAKDAVLEKIAELWTAGAWAFQKDGQLDEEGFKLYSRRLKKEKVDGWYAIVRNAGLKLAEQRGDWKTFINLAEEKWKEEEVPDVELFRWAGEINTHCQDKNVRYKMAQCLAGRVAVINQKEHLTGKVDLTSYRGFFEKMINDLLQGQ